MKFEKIEHYDELVDMIVFWVDVSGVSRANQERARKIAGKDYEPDCFGVCAGYDVERKEFCLVYDTEAGGRDYVYYIDIDGNKHWLPGKITREFRGQVFKECQKVLDGIQAHMDAAGGAGGQDAPRAT